MEPISYNQEENQTFQGPSDIQMINLESLFPDDLVKLAEENYEMMNYEKSKILYEEAMQRFSDNEKVLTSYGYFLTNMKENDKARDILTKAIYMNPHSNPKKYLYIAQLFEGNDAATFYTKAVEILSTQLEAAQNQAVDNNNEEFDFQDVKKDLSQAYTALGELFMTDLARTENAINICREYLHKGAEVNPTNIDAYYQLMNYYLEVDDPETAEKSASQLMEIYRQAKESDNDDFFDEFPEETYLGTVKVLIEMQRFNDALVILEDLFQDNSNNMEVLYLMMYCNYMLKNYVTCKELLEEFNSKQEHYEDKEIISAKDELEAMLRQVNVADANDWEDVDNEEECISNSDEENMEVEQS